MESMYIVRGVTREGAEVFYTGKAGQEFISPVRNASFGYVSQFQARNRAVNLNKMTPIHGVWFVAIPYNDAYLDGFCHRCGRKRVDCNIVREQTGKRCVETVQPCS